MKKFAVIMVLGLALLLMGLTLSASAVTISPDPRTPMVRETDTCIVVFNDSDWTGPVHRRRSV